MRTTKICKKHGRTNHYLENARVWRCMKCRVEAVDRRRKKIKASLAAMFGGKCEICEYDSCVQALDFHHVDPATKSFGLSAKGVTRAKAKVLAEMQKCVLLCCRCHREVEYGITEIPQHLIERTRQHGSHPAG